MERSARNNLNLLRLFFAWLVIVGHSYDLIDGNFIREPLNQLFGTLPSHYLAVNAFFVISGFLIAKSWNYDPSAVRYLKRRIARIVPGFLCCVGVCVASYALLYEPGYLGRIDWPLFLVKLMLLQSGGLPSAFAESRYPVINQSLWTIHYEFLCYIGLMLLGKFRMLERRFVLPACVLLVVCHMGYLLFGNWLWQTTTGGREPAFMYYLINWIRFGGCYLAGVAWMLYEAPIRSFSSRYALVSIALFMTALAIPPLHLVATTLLLVPVLSWLAFSLPSINGFWVRNDISYGLYLYAWPVQQVIITAVAHLNPSMLIALTTLGALLLGWVSWVLVEKPALQAIRP